MSSIVRGCRCRSEETHFAFLFISLILSVLLLVALLIFMLITRAYNNTSMPEYSYVDDSIGHVLLNAIKGENIKSNLRAMTKEAHQAGTEANERVAIIIEKLYTDAGLQNVHKVTYEVLLSYPDWDHPNTVSIRDGEGGSLFTSTGMTKPILPEQDAPHAGNHWLAYSASGRVEGDVVYAHFGTEDNFQLLQTLGVNVKGKIVIIRYGAPFRGDQVYNAQQHGASAVILFSDPAEVASGTNSDDVFPKSVWMPSDGVQGKRSPLTPLYPQKQGSYKFRTIEEIKEDGAVPSIPALPISYGTAYEILSRMSGQPAPAEWQGGLNLTYRLGSGLIDDQTIVVDVRSTLEWRQINNIVGYIPGHIDKDRYVILGNHYDAWTFGSDDPNAGTAVLAEVARAMGETTRTTNWKPARSIMFVAWDAEEYGLHGSTNYVHEFVQQLGERAVVYINMDAFGGNLSLYMHTIPSLRDVAVEVAKRIPNHVEEEVKAGRKTLYDTWTHVFPGKDGRPLMPLPPGTSDYAKFLNFAGVPVINFMMVNTTYAEYPLYHSLFETPFLNEHLYDKPDFPMHRSIGRYWAELARTLADSAVLPINVTTSADEICNNYAVALTKALNVLPASPNLTEAKQQANFLQKTTQKYLARARIFTAHSNRVREALLKNPTDQRELRAVNERIMTTEKCFINPRGLPGTPGNRHVIYATTGAIMPAVYDAIANYNRATDQQTAGHAVAEQIAIVSYSVLCATNTLTDFI